MLNLEQVQQRKEILPGLSFCSMLGLVPNVNLHGGSWVYGVHCRLRFAKCQKKITLSLTVEVRLSPQLVLGSEATSLLWIWEHLGEMFFLAL